MPNPPASSGDAEASASLRRTGFSAVVERGQVAVVRLQGELDMATAPLLDDTLTSVLGDGAVEVVVDLASLTFLDSTGISVLLGAGQRAGEVGTRFRVQAPNRPVRKALHLTGVEEILGLEPDRPLAT